MEAGAWRTKPATVGLGYILFAFFFSKQAYNENHYRNRIHVPEIYFSPNFFFECFVLYFEYFELWCKAYLIL